MSGVPAAFMTYARFNDEHDDGQLSALRKRLAAEVRAQTGREFEIFQDRADIAWGQNWQQRIDDALDVATLLLVIITPGFFVSKACRSEVSRFLERERELGRSDLILPVYYISAREMEDPAVRESDELARVLASRQLADWRDLRFETFPSPVVGRAIAKLASRMRDTFWHLPAVPNQPATPFIGPSISSVSKAEAYADEADRLYRRGNFTRAEAAYTKALDLDPLLVRAHVGLGRALCGLRRHAEAEAACHDAIRLAPDLAAAHSALGLCLCNRKRYPEAEAACRMALRLEPEYPLAHSDLGRVLLDTTRYPEAEAECREAIRLAPDLAVAHSNLGMILLQTKRYPEAEVECREAIRLAPDLAQAHNNLGNVLHVAKRYPEAEAEYREAIRLAPDLAQAHNNLKRLPTSNR